MNYCVGIKMDIHLNSNDTVVGFALGFAVGMIIGVVVATALLNKV
jgi:uncharacterized protein YebE (UPF0316 family)